MVPGKSIEHVRKIGPSGTTQFPRMLNGLWQLAGGHDRDVDTLTAADAINDLLDLGLFGFDMADHYGPAELVIGAHHAKSDRPITAFTKWCPHENGDVSFANAHAAVDKALSRMGVQRIALMQYHIWDYTDKTYLYNMVHLRQLQQQGKIEHIGVTNTDSAHLKLLIDSGFQIATNQVSVSVIDLRLTRNGMSSLCEKHGVGILAYGTLLGGFLSERWLHAEEPEDIGTLNWSLRKYLRFIRAAGGWEPFQEVLQSLATIAAKHGVSIAAVAMRWVLDIPVVDAVIVGCRLSAQSAQYAEKNLQAFTFALDEEDRHLIREAQQGLTPIAGDCGDEYRRPPFLTAAGDLSDHIKGSSQTSGPGSVTARGRHRDYRSHCKWDSEAGYCRAVRTGDTIRVYSTKSDPPPGLEWEFADGAVGGSSARSQTVAILDHISRAIRKLGGQLSDVVRTRIYLPRPEDVEDVSLAHGWVFLVFQRENVPPANMLGIEYDLDGEGSRVRIEIQAEVGSSDTR